MSHEHVSNTGRIWKVFAILSLVTILEVFLGIVKPAFLSESSIIGLSLLNWIFYILTIFKAYYIVWAFMHIEGEKTGLKLSVVAPVVFLAIYIIFMLLTEGNYVFEVFKNGTIKWNF